MKNLIITSALLIAVGQGWSATIVPITAADNDPVATAFNGGPYGTALEDNETEHGTVPGQVWDMEAFGLSGSIGSKQLHMIGGFNIQNGYGGYVGGDIFIKVGSAPNYQPLSGSPSTVQNGIAQAGYNPPYNYTYAIDMSRYNEAGHAGQVAVYTLKAETWLDTVVYDDRDANPWRVSSNPNVASTTWANLNYVTDDYGNNLDGNAIQSQYVGTLYDETGNRVHYMASIDMSWLSVAPGTEVWFSYTMGCGNDSLKGMTSGGFQTPDGGATILLMGLGATALALIRRKA